MNVSRGLRDEDYCYLTTTGRVSGEPRTIEIWFALERNTAYMLSGGGDRANWVRNLRQEPFVSVRIGDQTFDGHGRVVTDVKEDALARRLLFDKYQSRYSGDLSSWRANALPVAVDLE